MNTFYQKSPTNLDEFFKSWKNIISFIYKEELSYKLKIPT